MIFYSLCLAIKRIVKEWVDWIKEIKHFIIKEKQNGI